jgi:hypothetical protein
VLKNHNEAMLKEFVVKQNNSRNYSKAKILLENIQKPVDCLLLISFQPDGLMTREVVGWSGIDSFGNPRFDNVKTVVVFKNSIPKDAKEFNKQNIQPGVAYLFVSESEFWELNKIDLSKSNNEIAATFGIK